MMTHVIHVQLSQFNKIYIYIFLECHIHLRYTRNTSIYVLEEAVLFVEGHAPVYLEQLLHLQPYWTTY